MTPGASSYFALDGRLTVVEAAASDSGWADQVRAAHPGARLHTLARGAALDALGLHHLNYLRIADPAAALLTLLNAQRLMRHARIDLIEIAGPVAPAAMPALAGLLLGFDFLQLPAGAQMDELLLQPGTAASPPLLVMNRRFLGAIDGRRDPDLGALLAAHGIPPRGLIKVGAHEGLEVPAYRALGFAPVLLIEADPRLAAFLDDRFSDDPGVSVAACAITDIDGTVELHLASSTASNSLLALKDHAALYPKITAVGSLRVPARRLDGLLAERGDGDAFNVAVVDVQGAELQVLRGAADLLARLDGLLIEVNFSEVYAGCAQIEDIDSHLGDVGFQRVMTMSPYKSNFGDAFYRRAAAR